MNEITNILTQNVKFQDYIKEIKLKTTPISILGLVDVAKSQWIIATQEEIKKPICLITYNEIQAKKLYEDIQYFNKKVAFFNKKEIVTYDYVAESKELLYKRIDTLNKINENNVDIIITTIEACMQEMISKEELYKNVIEFKFNKEYNFEEIKENLLKLGYERTELAEARGQFSLRGDILDIAITENKGVRIEFWGEEIDSIRYFQLSSQRSIEEIKKITIYPAHENILTSSIENVCNKIKEIDEYEDIIENDIEQIENGNFL